MGWIKAVPPKCLHDTLGIYHGMWMPEMDRCWIREEDGVQVCSRLLRTSMGNVEHVTISDTKRHFLSSDGSGDIGWAEKYKIKNELFGENRIAIEVFPKADRLVDACDVYHLWVFDKNFELPFGIHPKQFSKTKTVNRGYQVTEYDLKKLEEYYKSNESDPEMSMLGSFNV
jgi:hypothetical protein